MASASELRSPSWCACRRSALSPASKPPRSPALLPMTTTVATRSECDTSMGVASACEKASTPQPSPHRSVGTLSSAQCTGVCWQPERSISWPLSPARESSLSSSIPSSPAAPRGQRKQPRSNGCYRAKAARRSLHPRQIIGEIGEFLVLQRLHHRRHGGIIAAPLVGLVFAQRPQQIVLALPGDARDLVLPGESRGVTEIAAVLRNDLLRVLDPRRIARVGRRDRRGELRDEFGEGAQFVVGQALGHLVHQLDFAQLLAKHIELDQRIVLLLGAERGDILVCGLPLLAMARETGRKPFLQGRRRGGERS